MNTENLFVSRNQNRYFQNHNENLEIWRNTRYEFMCFNLKNMNPLILIFVVFSVLILEKSSFANGQKQKRKKGGKAGAKKSNIANKQQKKMQMVFPHSQCFLNLFLSFPSNAYLHE